MKKKLITIVVPIYNEEGNILPFFNELDRFFPKKYIKELIFIDDGSSDASLAKIKSLTRKYRFIHYISFTRNFGHQYALKAGLDYAKGDAVISIVCDLQDPVELLPEYVKRWEKGADIVIGVYTKSADKYFMAVIRSLYYKIFKAVSSIEIQVNSSGICLFSRGALNGYLQLRERYRSSIGLRSWIGFKTSSMIHKMQFMTGMSIHLCP